jgi:hypothetical protein
LIVILNIIHIQLLLVFFLFHQPFSQTDNDSDEPVIKKAKGGGKDMKEVVLDMEDDVTDKEDNVIDMKEDSLRKRLMKKKENK